MPIFTILIVVLVLLVGALFYMRLTSNIAEHYYNQGIDAYSKGFYNEAQKLFLKAIAGNPNRYDTYYNLGLTYMSLDKAELAEENFLKSLEINPKDSDSYYNLGLITQSKNKIEEAIKYYLKALRINDKDADCHYSLSLAYFETQDYDQSLKSMFKAIECDPSSIEYKFALAQLYEKIGLKTGKPEDLSLAIEAYEQVLAAKEDHEQAANALSVCYARQGNITKTIELSSKVIERNGGSYEALNQLGLAMFCKGDFRNAVVNFKKALDIKNDFEMAYINIVYAYEKLGDMANLKKYVKTFNKKFPSSPNKFALEHYSSIAS